MKKYHEILNTFLIRILFKNYFKQLQLSYIVLNYDNIIKPNPLMIVSSCNEVDFIKRELKFFKEKFKLFSFKLIKRKLFLTLECNYEKITLCLTKLEDDYYSIYYTYNKTVIEEHEGSLQLDHIKFKKVHSYIFLDQFSDVKSTINRLIINYDFK